ncbi:hypothetical protein QN222_02475 [Sinorhizobium sp. 6-70]|nr:MULTISPECIES: hypothetical protein [unclassified Sinorhizobium]MDK1373340.1 hypothetical protein [Sinorhizobium sp. 6-70]MDK1482217.1 hypothetical protein [Sinorhizobium sp. 6-117]
MKKDSPRGLNSFIRADVIDGIRQKRGKLFGGLAPDYFLTFVLMDHVETYVSLELPLLVVQGEHLSNGKAISTGNSNAATTEFLSLVQREQSEFLKFGPIPGDTSLLPNWILREYVAVASESTTGKFAPILPESFYKETVKYAVNLANSGNLSSAARKTLDAYAREHGLSTLDIPSNSERRVSEDAISGGAAILTVRRWYEALMLRLRLKRTVSGKDLPSVLARDCDVSRHQVIRMKKSDPRVTAGATT